MKKFEIPVSWEVWDTVEIEAESFDEAVKWLEENIDEVPLGTEPEYVLNSYEIDYDAFDIFRE